MGAARPVPRGGEGRLNPIATVHLRPETDARLKAGHPWIYASQIAAIKGSFLPGDIVDVVNHARHFVGRGYINPHSQIQIRLLTRSAEEIDAAFLTARLRAALAWRERFYPGESAYRLVFSEADRLSGLIIDRYGEVLVAQFLTLGMEVRKEIIVSALVELCCPAAIYERSDGPSRRHEGLEPRSGLIYGALPGPEEGSAGAGGRVAFTENGLHFFTDVASGQKTGYFLDQKENRRALAPLVAGRGGTPPVGARVLDAFCHTGSFGIHAAAYGAGEVLGLDQSDLALELARENAAANGVADRCAFQAANAFDALRELEREAERFDLVILDPPAFVRNKGALPGAIRGYKEINLRAMKLISPRGFLVTCSCSYPILRAHFLAIVAEAAQDAHRELRLVEYRTQAKDHPILPGVPETEYLKCLIVQVD